MRILLAEDELRIRAFITRGLREEGFVVEEAADGPAARIRAVLRRSSGRPSPVLGYQDLSLDPATRRVTRAGKEIRLTAREFALLQFLLEHKGEVVSRTRIVEAVWEHDFETFSNVVEVYVRYLRAKVDEPFGQRLIQTVRGVGYALRTGP
jgi:two-component system copper resistance phosphate regulon response regulator CusR